MTNPRVLIRSNLGTKKEDRKVLFFVELEGFFAKQSAKAMTNPGVLIRSNLGTKKEDRKVLFFVELEGFEPSSKRGANELSTCLAFSWLSGGGRMKASNRRLSL